MTRSTIRRLSHQQAHPVLRSIARSTATVQRKYRVTVENVPQKTPDGRPLIAWASVIGAIAQPVWITTASAFAQRMGTALPFGLETEQQEIGVMLGRLPILDSDRLLIVSGERVGEKVEIQSVTDLAEGDLTLMKLGAFVGPNEIITP